MADAVDVPCKTAVVDVPSGHLLEQRAKFFQNLANAHVIQ